MQSSVHSEGRASVYQTITQKIVAAIEAGAGEFVMPWHRLGPGVGRPSNALTGNRYRGVNVVALWAECMVSGYGSGWWATFQQWKQLGAMVRRGEHGSTIVFYKPIDRNQTKEEEDAKSSRLMARAFRVFNAQQVEGWQEPAPAATSSVENLEQVDVFVARTCAWIKQGGEVACYRRREDDILIPEPFRFTGSPTCTPTEAYYSTLLHELVHWSGATPRLDRTFGQRFGDDAYAMEELVAELGAAFLCAELGVTNEPRPDHAAYLSHWLSVLRNDPRAIFTAAHKAKEAAEFLTAFQEPPY